MYFEAIGCTVEEAERNAQKYYEQMCEFDKELTQLWKRRDKYDDTDSQFQKIIEEIDEEIYITESFANKCDDYYDYWSMQAIWAKKRLEKQKKGERK